MTMAELVALNGVAADALWAIVTMRAHIEPVPGAWRAIAVVSDQGPPIAVEAKDGSLKALIAAVEELHRRWSLAMKRPS